MKTKGILVSDFDGTMTKYDFYDLVCAAFPDISTKGFWQQYEAGKQLQPPFLRHLSAASCARQPRKSPPRRRCFRP